MVKTNDPMLDVFRRRDDAAFREAYVQAQEREAEERTRDGKARAKGKGKGKAKRASKSDC
jgi:hypothetical protein